MTVNIRKILVPTDFSERCDEALDYAVGLARLTGVPVYVLHVLEAPFVPGVWDFYVSDSAEIARERRARADLAAIKERFASTGLPIATDLRYGSAADEIVTTAQQIGADLIVMATHGRSGLSHLLLGSVAEHVIRRAPCPVLAVRVATASHEPVEVRDPKQVEHVA